MWLRNRDNCVNNFRSWSILGASTCVCGWRECLIIIHEQYAQECIPVGCVLSAAVAAGRGVSTRGVGVSAWGGVCPSACWDTVPLVNRMTDACENITFPHYVADGKNTSTIRFSIHHWYSFSNKAMFSRMKSLSFVALKYSYIIGVSKGGCDRLR